MSQFYWKVLTTDSSHNISTVATGLQFLKSFFFRIQTQKIWEGLDGIGVSRSMFEAIMVVLQLLDELNASGKLSVVVLMLLVVTGRLPLSRVVLGEAVTILLFSP